MAKRRRSTATKIVRVSAPRAASPIIRIAAPSVKRHFGSRRRVKRTARAVGGFLSQHNVDAFVGGGMFGFAVKQGWIDKLPSIPVIGRTGTAALLFDYMSKHGFPMLRKPAIAAATLAGYQLGHDSKIVGDEASGLTTTGDGFSTAGDE